MSKLEILAELNDLNTRAGSPVKNIITTYKGYVEDYKELSDDESHKEAVLALVEDIGKQNDKVEDELQNIFDKVFYGA